MIGESFLSPEYWLSLHAQMQNLLNTDAHTTKQKVGFKGAMLAVVKPLADGRVHNENYCLSAVLFSPCPLFACVFRFWVVGKWIIDLGVWWIWFKIVSRLFRPMENSNFFILTSDRPIKWHSIWRQRLFIRFVAYSYILVLVIVSSYVCSCFGKFCHRSGSCLYLKNMVSLHF